MHARKMAARLQAANDGGTTITTQIDQQAQEAAFLMHFLGMQSPE